MLRPLSEFLWTLRRHGVAVSAAQAVDAARAVALVGWESREDVREALALVVVQRASDRGRFEGLFDQFFRAEKAHARDAFRRLQNDGLSEDEVARVRSVLEGLAANDEGTSGEAARWVLGLGQGPGLDGWMAGGEAQRAMTGLTSTRQVGYFAQAVSARLGFGQAAGRLGLLRMALEAELGAAAGARALEALRREVERARSEVRLAVAEEAQRREEQAGGKGFEALGADEVERVRRGVRRLGEKLRGAARVRARRARQGRVDPHATLREAMRSGGAPRRLVRRRRERRRPRVWLLCDVSDSVRAASVFLLEFVAVAHELFEGSRSFVFVSDVAEATRVFEERPVEQALAAVLGGGVVSTAQVSNYGRALRAFEQRFARQLDRRTTLVIVGDGRGNHLDPGVDVVARLRERARTVLWLCPEPASRWGTSDSQMPRYARVVSSVMMATGAEELEQAARALVRR